MRILIVNVHFAPDSFGGATVVAEETASRLAGRGHDVVVYAATESPALKDHDLTRHEGRGLPVIALKVPTRRRTARLDYTNEKVVAPARAVVEAVRPDVIHVHAVQRLAVDTLETFVDSGVPTVVTLHDAWFWCERQFMVRATGEFCGQERIDPDVCATCVPDPWANRMRQERSRRLLSRVDRVLVPSRFWAGVAVANGVPEERVSVNANGVRMPAPGWSRPPSDGPLRFGFVGGLGAIKGATLIVDAFRGLDRNDYELVVVDNTGLLGYSSMTAADWPVPGQVRVVPAYDQGGLDDFFGGIDVLLFPSQWRESFGLTVREALVRGVWPIVTDGGGTVEDVVDGVNGTVIPLDGRPQGLRDAVAAALADPAVLRARTHVGAQRGIIDHDRQTADLEAQLDEVVRAGGSRPFAPPWLTRPW